MKGWRFALMDQAQDGVPPAGGGEVPVAAVAPAGGAAAPADGAGSVLAAAGTGQPHFIPEKYHVKGQDGAIDLEASARKLGEAYGHLEKRFGAGDVPPKAAGDYQITVPDDLKDSWKPAEDKGLQDFLGQAHAAGMTQKQVDLVIGAYFDRAGSLVQGSQALTMDAAVAELRKTWTTDEQFKAETSAAYRAATAYGGDDAQAIIEKYGNDPAIVRMLARIGKETAEDKSLQPGGVPAGDAAEIGKLMASEAYVNPKHADHATVSAKVRAYYEAMAKKNPQAIM